MPFSIMQTDITILHVDAIVNSANMHLVMGSGVSKDIFLAAGKERLQGACDAVSPVETGQAALTPGYNLPCKYVIHAVGPIYHAERDEECRQLLYSAYMSSLKLARKAECKSIAFSLIACGVYGYPKDKAILIASSAIHDFLKTNDMDVILVLHDRETYELAKEKLNL
ncbi:MAG: macro domain-containing protein [Bilifractor sp.]|jgi:O-acetyl-ADP-ribose deacetylase (regulator of RNase III)